MKVFEAFKGFFAPESKQTKADPFAYGSYKNSFSLSYDGEKSSGELGTPVKYVLDYKSLRLRSWKSYLDSEVTQTVTKKFVLWIIGSGLKLQSEPVESVLTSEGIKMNPDEFSKQVEDRFKLWADLKSVDYSNRMNLNLIAKTAYLNSFVGGDVLVLMRVIKGNLKIELIDGAHIKNPLFENQNLKNGETLKNGIVMDKHGDHVAYWVQQADMTFRKINAKGSKSGREMAFLVYGLRYRLDDNRGIPLISTTLETLTKLDRYKEAAVGSAEERAKIPFFIEHGSKSTGENPMSKNMAKAFNVDANQDIAIDINGEQLADNIAVSMNKQVYNLPVDSKMSVVDTKNDINFNDFYSPNVAGICSTIGIPPEVALSKYDSNFSASRAALKDWEHTINVERKSFSDQFYKKVFSFWLELEVLKNKIQAPGLMSLIMAGNEIGVAAYMQCRFVGANVPHIDPLKEVAAERAKLGESGRSIPLTTAEAATEALNGGDFVSNLNQYENELKSTKSAGVDVVEKTENKQNNSNNGE